MTKRTPIGWNAGSNARHEVKVRDYLDRLRGDIGSEIEAQINTGRCDEYYALGAEVLKLPSIRSLVEFATEQLRGNGEAGR